MKNTLHELRRKLHQNAELSGKEINTSRIIESVLISIKPDQLYSNLGSYGILAVFYGKREGKTTMFRADIDAVPISESNLKYKSLNPGISHKCGHDGHSTILLGLADRLIDRDFNGTVLLLFQPAEETGQGAEAVLKSDVFNSLQIDYCVGIHNLPGYQENTIVSRQGIFASASCGFKLKLSGKSSHASQPEKGNSPILAFTAILEALHALPKTNSKFEQAAMITIVHACLGKEAFGTNPGEADIMATLRCHETADLKNLQNRIATLCTNLASAYNLREEISWVENFPAVYNDTMLYGRIRDCAINSGINFTELKSPFAWSEDFAHFGNRYPSILIGLGAGKKQPPLHSAEYDFPDNIIEPSVEFIHKLIKDLNS